MLKMYFSQIESIQLKVEGRGNQYTYEVDCIEKAQWEDILRGFDDANIYQSWSYGAVRWGENDLSHLIIRKGLNIVALAQSRIVKLPVIGTGIAYIRWGPIYRLRGCKQDMEIFRQMLRALRIEYVERRRLLLRIIFNNFKEDENADKMLYIIDSEGFIRRTDSMNYHTYLLDLNPSLEVLRKQLDKRWRNRLRHAERNGLHLIEGFNDELFRNFIELYKEMVARKRFTSFVDVEEFRKIQEDLPRDMKMRIIICKHNGNVIAGSVFSAIGETGLCLLSANSEAGRKLQSSYLLKWRTIEWMKEQGCRYLDLGGRDEIRTPTVDHFKAGLSGLPVCHLGEFDFSQSFLSYVFVRLLDWAKNAKYMMISGINKY